MNAESANSREFCHQMKIILKLSTSVECIYFNRKLIASTTLFFNFPVCSKELKLLTVHFKFM